MAFWDILKRIKEFSHSVSLKLFLLLAELLLISFCLIIYINISFTRQYSLESITHSAMQASNLIKRSLYHTMLENRRDDLRKTIMSIGQEPDVERIRIFDKTGRISFSDDPNEEGQTVDMKAEQCYVCHAKEPALTAPPTKKLTRIVKSKQGHRQLGLINPIINERDCYTAECHAHPEDKKILGVLDVKLSLKQADERIASTIKKMAVYTFILILITGLLKGAFIWRMVHIPIKKLTEGTREVANLNLDYRVKLNSRDELGDLAESFNEMTSRLKAADESIKSWSAQLEEKVREKTEELRETQSHLILIEKMASLGKLSAMVAHEINNPLSGILTYAKLSSRYLGNELCSPETLNSVKENLDIISSEAKRCGDIVKNLLAFAKKGPGELTPESLNTIIQNSINVIAHSAAMKNVEIIKVLDEGDDVIQADGNAMQQVFVALFVNAVEAMPTAGRIQISSDYHSEKDRIRVMITDTGKGIPDDVLPHIFEPFFTSKTSEKSVGMGLAVVYGIIVQQHGGSIEVRSALDQGTTFTVTLPRVTPGRGDQ